MRTRNPTFDRSKLTAVFAILLTISGTSACGDSEDSAGDGETGSTESTGLQPMSTSGSDGGTLGPTASSSSGTSEGSSIGNTVSWSTGTSDDGSTGSGSADGAGSDGTGTGAADAPEESGGTGEQESDASSEATGFDDDGSSDAAETDALAPRVFESTPVHGAVGVYPAEYYWDPAPMRGVRERVFVRVTFDTEMDTEEATVVVTDADGVEEARVIEGTWDETGHTLTAIIVPLNDDPQFPLSDETTYHVDLSELQSEDGRPVDPEDPTHPESRLSFTTGVRNGLLNHACIHIQHGPFADAVASSDPMWGANADLGHTHYTITLPEAIEGEPHVGHTTMYTQYLDDPSEPVRYVIYLRAPLVQFETMPFGYTTGPFAPALVEEAPPACHVVDSVLTDPETGERTAGPPIAGITHQVVLTLLPNEIYSIRWTSLENVVHAIVEWDTGSF